MDVLGGVYLWVLAGVGVAGGVFLAIRGSKRHDRERTEVPIP